VDKKKEKEDPIVDFDYMKAFIKDIFISHSIEEDDANTYLDMLIEADK